ncbi:MAG: uracil-DNA glycosylase [Methanothrix sp.]
MAGSMCPPDLLLLQEKIASCELCPLYLSRNLTVPGSGPSEAEIMLVGEAPGREEDLKGLPFVGRAGRLLDEALDEAGLKREDVFITSVIKCRPPQNRKPKKKEIELCLPYLEDQMDAIRPRIICLMGNTAIQAVLGVVGVTVLRGQILCDRFLVTYHPAAVLRNRNLMADFVSDLREAKIQSLRLSKDALLNEE